MNKINIATRKLYIKKLVNVIKSDIKNFSKPISVDGRLSDAFVYILAGSCTYKFDDGKVFTAKAGDILYLADKSVYKMYVQSDCYEFIFSDFLFDCEEMRKSEVFTPKSTDDAETLFRRLLRAHRSSSPNAFCDTVSLLYKIFGMICQAANSGYIEKSTKQKLDTVKGYIDTNYRDENLNISMFADMVDMSEVYLRRLFKEQYGAPPSQYIISVRLKAAKKLMKYPFLTIEDCALQSGFGTLQYFSRVFKKAYGQTPSQYRQMNK